MVFSSLVFLFAFLPLFLTAYYLVPGRFRDGVALVGSYFFYAWGEPIFVSILFLSSLLDYGLSRLFDERRGYGARARKWILAASVLVNVGALLFFKYTNFAVGQFNTWCIAFGHAPLPWQQVALPIGISFFTFQKLSYMIDCYRRIVTPAGSFVSFALYVSLFPQLIAGPIVRYHDVVEQLTARVHGAANLAVCVGFEQEGDQRIIGR